MVMSKQNMSIYIIVKVYIFSTSRVENFNKLSQLQSWCFYQTFRSHSTKIILRLQSFSHPSITDGKKVIKLYSKNVRKVQIYLKRVPLPCQFPSLFFFLNQDVLFTQIALILLCHSALTLSLETLRRYKSLTFNQPFFP